MMRLTPHTYRRLAFLASWSIIPEISDSCAAIVQIKNTIKQNTSVDENELKILHGLDEIYSELDQLFFDYPDRYVEKKRARGESLLPGEVISKVFNSAG